jgi:hypothetical protein
MSQAMTVEMLMRSKRWWQNDSREAKWEGEDTRRSSALVVK